MRGLFSFSGPVKVEHMAGTSSPAVGPDASVKA